MWLVLIRCEGKVLLGGWWPWLICCERKALLAGWLPANRTGQTTITSQSLILYGTIRQWQTLWLLLPGHNLPSFCNIFSRIHLIYMDLRSRRKTVATLELGTDALSLANYTLSDIYGYTLLIFFLLVALFRRMKFWDTEADRRRCTQNLSSCSHLYCKKHQHCL